MCPTSSSPQMPLPPPLTFNSTKNKSKQQAALVSPVNGVPSVTPYTGQAPQSCQVQSQQQRNREPVVCKHSTEMLSKLNAISKDLIALAELVKDVQKQQSQLTHQLSETKERVLQNTDLIRTVSEQFKIQMSTLLQGQVEQADIVRATSLKYEEQMRLCKEDVGICQNMCSDIMKQNEGFTSTLQSIREAVMQTAQNTSTAALEAASNTQLQNAVPHLTHDPMPANSSLPPSNDNIHPTNLQQQQQQPSSQPIQNQIQTNQGQGIQVQLAPGNYTTAPTLQHLNKSNPGPAQPMQIQLGDNNKYYCIGPNGVQQSIQMFSVPPQLLQGIQAIQNIQGGNNLVQIVSPAAAGQIKQKSNRPTEIRPKTVSTPKKMETSNGLYPPTSCSVNNSSPKTTNILEEASKVLSNPSMEQDSDSSFHLYNHNNSEKDALSEAIMTIPTTYAQHGNNTNFKFECSDNMNDGNHGDESRAMQVTSEMLSKAINVVEGDHNLYFDKVLIGPNNGDNQQQKQQDHHVQIPSFLPEEVINCVYRKSKEPSIYALNICREILTREEFINNDFKSFVSKNPLKYKFIEHLLTTKFGLYSDHLQSILKDVRIKFNNYHRHVKRSVRLKEIQKQEQLQLEIERLEQQQQEQQRSTDEKMLELLKQEPTSMEDGSYKLIAPNQGQATTSFASLVPNHGQPSTTFASDNS